MQRRIGGKRVVLYGYTGVRRSAAEVRQGAHDRRALSQYARVAGSVHWHGVRLDNPSTARSASRQQGVAQGERFTYTLRFRTPKSFGITLTSARTSSKHSVDGM